MLTFDWTIVCEGVIKQEIHPLTINQNKCEYLGWRFQIFEQKGMIFPSNSQLAEVDQPT